MLLSQLNLTTFNFKITNCLQYVYKLVHVIDNCITFIQNTQIKVLKFNLHRNMKLIDANKSVNWLNQIVPNFKIISKRLKYLIILITLIIIIIILLIVSNSTFILIIF